MAFRFSRRFTLRTLFVTVSLFALAVGVYCYQLPPAEVRHVQLGMTFDEMVAELGFPNAGGNGGFWGENWNYTYPWGRLRITFAPNDRCQELLYSDASDNRWYRAKPNGRFEKADRPRL